MDGRDDALPSNGDGRIVTPFRLPRTIFDFEAVDALAGELRAAGKRHPLVVTDAGVEAAGLLARVERGLASGRFTTFATVTPNPTFHDVDAAFAAYRDDGCDCVVALGGGSVIDTAKVVAVLATHGGAASDYVGHSERVAAPIAFLVCIPTTAGTGSESSPDAGIHPDATTASSGIGNWRIVPDLTILDPALTVSLPPRLTAATGLDALSHCIEGYLATPVSPFADALALDGMTRVVDHLERATRDGADREARWNMMAAAYAGGAAISKGLGPAHAIAIACGDQGFHHGMLSAIGLIGTLALARAHRPERCRAIALAMRLPADADLSDAVNALCLRLDLPNSLHALGYRCGDIDRLADRAAQSHFNLTSAYRPTRLVYAAVLTRLLHPEATPADLTTA